MFGKSTADVSDLDICEECSYHPAYMIVDGAFDGTRSTDSRSDS